MRTKTLLTATLLCSALLGLNSCADNSVGRPPGVAPLNLKWSINDPSFGNAVLRGNLLLSGKSIRALDLNTRKFAFNHVADKTQPYNTDLTLRNYVELDDNLIVQSYSQNKEYLSVMNKKGEFLNTITLPNGIPAAMHETGPMLTQNALYTSSGPILYKYNRADLLKPDAQPVWTKKYEQFNLASFYARDDDHIFVAPNDGSFQIFSLDGNGQQRWMTQTSQNKDLIVGQSFTMKTYKNSLIIEAGTTGLMALDMDTGKMLWDKPASLNVCPMTGTTSFQITIADDKILVGPWAGSCVQAYDASTGKLDWVFASPNQATFDTMPLYHNGVVYATNSVLYALDATTGKLLAQGNEFLDSNTGAPLVYDLSHDEILQWGLTGLFAYKPIK